MASIRFLLGSEEWLTSNKRMGRYQKADVVKGLRFRASIQGRTQRPPGGKFSAENPCRLTVEVAIPTRRRFDPANSSPTVKALVDGLTDAGWWTDDNSDVIREVTYKRADEPSSSGIYFVTIAAEPLTVGGA